MRPFGILSVGLLGVLLAGSQSFADSLADGDVAYRSGDYVTAARLYVLAAARGSGWAEFNLGNMFYRGIGVRQDAQLGILWIAKAAATDEVRYRAIAALRNIAKAHPDLAAAPTFPTALLAGTPAPIEAAAAATDTRIRIPLQQDGGTFTVPVLINGAVALNFTLDSGAAQVSIPADVFLTLTRTGTIAQTDIMDPVTLMLADGSSTKSDTVKIRTLKVGTVEIHDVVANIGPATGILLLGQSFLSRFKSWSVDNSSGELLLEPKAQPEGAMDIGAAGGVPATPTE